MNERIENIDIKTFTEALWAFSRPERIEIVLRRSRPSLVPNENSLLVFCMHFGLYFAIEEILETEAQVREFCDYFDVEYDSDDDKRKLLQNLNTRITFSRQKCFGFTSVLKYIQSIKLSRNAYNETKAFDCFKLIETLIMDMYRLYIWKLMFPYLADEDKDSIQNTTKTRYPNFRNIVEQLKKYERLLMNDCYLEFKKSIELLNGQSSIFGLAKIDNLLTIIDIRNSYFGHGNEIDAITLKSNVRQFFELSEDFVSHIVNTMPRMIIPICYSASKDGYRYIDYIDEENIDINEKETPVNILLSTKEQTEIAGLRRYYLLESRGEFNPYQKAYCLHPDRLNGIMCDPTLYYISDLRRVQDTPLKRLQ